MEHCCRLRCCFGFLCTVSSVALVILLSRPYSSYLETSQRVNFVELDAFPGTDITVVPLNGSSRQLKRALNVLGNLTNGSWGYLLVVDYEQQLMGGFMGFYHLAKMTSLLNLSSVEPYVRGTGLEGAPLIREDSEAEVAKLSRFYDIDHLGSLVKSCCGNELVSFETFMEMSSRDVVLVAFLYSLEGSERYFSNGEKIVEIESGTASLLASLRTLNKWTSFVAGHRNWQSALYRVSRVVLVDARPQRPLPFSYLMDKLGSIVRQQVAEFGSATLVLDSFRDIQLTYVSKFLYRIPGFKWSKCAEMDTVKHSNSVTSAARKFSHDLNPAHPVVGIHVRIERLLIDLKGRVSLYMVCLRQLRRLLQSGTIANLTRGSVYLFHDVGKYGTKGCNYRSYCFRGRPHFLSLIQRMGFKVVYFDPKSFRPKGLRGAFAGYVEMEFLSNVDVLVTVGHGEYQNHIVKRFAKNHGGSLQNFHKICNYPPTSIHCYPHCR